MGSTVNELKQRMLSSEFIDWLAYSQIEPFGTLHEDYRSAIVAYTVSCSQGGKAKLEDFMPKYGSTKKMPLNVLREVLKAEADAYNKRLGG